MPALALAGIAGALLIVAILRHADPEPDASMTAVLHPPDTTVEGEPTPAEGNRLAEPLAFEPETGGLAGVLTFADDARAFLAFVRCLDTNAVAHSQPWLGRSVGRPDFSIAAYDAGEVGSDCYQRHWQDAERAWTTQHAPDGTGATPLPREISPEERAWQDRTLAVCLAAYGVDPVAFETMLLGTSEAHQDRLDLDHCLALAFSGEWRHGRTGTPLTVPEPGTAVQLF